MRYVSFSTGTAAWGSPAQVTNDGSVYSQNQNSQTGRGFVSAAVAGNSCMLSWIGNLFQHIQPTLIQLIPFHQPPFIPLLT